MWINRNNVESINLDNVTNFFKESTKSIKFNHHHIANTRMMFDTIEERDEYYDKLIKYLNAQNFD